MSLHDCIQRAIENRNPKTGERGEPLLNPALARRAQKVYAERLEAYASLGPGAEAKAAEDTWIFLRRENIRKRRGNYLQAKKQMELVGAQAKHRGSDGEANAASFNRQLVEWSQDSRSTSIRATKEVLSQSYLRDVSDLVVEARRNNITGGTRARTKALASNIVRELQGQHTGDLKARDFAASVQKVMERARREFNAVGGEIGKLEGFDLPHRWNRSKVSKVSADQFAADMYGELDWSRIIDLDTDRPFAQSSDAARIAFLKRIHENIRTRGAAFREPTGVRPGQSMSKRNSEHRVLHFKNDGWLKMDAKYGDGEPLAAIFDHLEGMARDTAIMRVLGPNPRATLEYLKQTATKLANERPWKPAWTMDIGGNRYSAYSSAEQEVEASFAHTNRMLDLVTGAANRAEMDQLANLMSTTVQPMLVASQLGGATLSAVGDVGFIGMAARHVGISPVRAVYKMLEAAAEAIPNGLVSLASFGRISNDALTRRYAQMGIIAESLSATGVQQARFMGEVGRPGIWQTLSEFTMRASGLTAWTDLGRAVFKSETYAHLANNVMHTWDEMDPWLRDHLLDAGGITREEWDIIRATPLMEHPRDRAATFLIPDDIRLRGDLDPDIALDLAIKLGAAIENQKEFAVPTNSLRARAGIQQAKPGTFQGELGRSAAMYKGYTLTIMHNQLGRIFFHKVRGNRFANILMFAGVTTLAGAISIQLKELKELRDPRNMLEGKFLYAAALQGGGLGIFGDFLYSTENRFGQSFAQTLGGPIVGFGSETGSLLADGARALYSGDQDKIDDWQRKLIKFADRYSGPTNIWYVNAALNRMLWDNLTEWADPDAQADWAKEEKRRFKEYGNQSHWQRGKALPDGLPNLSAMLGATP